MDKSLTPFALQVAKFCALECERQRSGEMSVYWMMDAYTFALHMATAQRRQPLLDDCLEIAKRVEPRYNRDGWRQVQVTVGDRLCMDWQQVPRAMENLWKLGLPTLDPATFFYEFETIHGFQDGNGRTGSILFNWLQGSLENPEFPPDFWRVDGAAITSYNEARTAGRRHI